MLLTLRAMALVTLALYSGPVRGLSVEARKAMQAELQKLLDPAEIQIVWKDSAERKSGEDFELIAVSSFDGSCSPSEVVPASITTSLADTSISNGRILPFFRVDCTRVIQMLGRSADAQVLGRALARVIAHELYHIVAGTTDHQENGVAKAAFSTRDLSDARFEFDNSSISRMRPSAVATTSNTGSSDSAGR
jgi:hypothetical protein